MKKIRERKIFRKYEEIWRNKCILICSPIFLEKLSWKFKDLCYSIRSWTLSYHLHISSYFRVNWEGEGEASRFTELPFMSWARNFSKSPGHFHECDVIRGRAWESRSAELPPGVLGENGYIRQETYQKSWVYSQTLLFHSSHILNFL